MEFMSNMYYGNTVEEWAIALALVVVSFIGGKLIYWIFSNFVKKLTSKTKNKLDDLIIDNVEEPVMLGIILLGSWYALGNLNLSEGIRAFLDNAFWGIITLNIAWFLARMFEAVYHEYIIPLADKTETDLDDQILPIVRKGVKTVIWTLGIIIALDNAGYNITALLAGLGIGGLALAMAAKDTVSNIFGGIMIFLDKPFKIKDRIKIAGFDGTVKEIGLRSSKIKTLDGTEVIVPNHIFIESPVENVSREPTRKIVLNLGLVYDTSPSDMKKAMKLLDEIAKEKEDMINKDYKIGFNSFGDFSLGIIFIYYIKKSADILGTQNEINLEILDKFNKNKLSMAFPTQTIELKK
ncbi:MAG: mechanosensitive ion channel family protein [Nanoarchaeota archaeon]|nr:mechanosensitive ion channel family protein [Nanoarchaeota archaeon]